MSADPRPTRKRKITYAAAQSAAFRTAPSTLTMGEDDVLSQSGRRSISATGRDQYRNFALAAWAVRKSVDHICQFEFQAATDDEGFNRELEAFIEAKSSAGEFDVSGRFNRRQYARLMEICRHLDGDLHSLKIKTGKVQAIEADRIAVPPGGLPQGMDASKFRHGVRYNGAGRPIEYAVCNRSGTRLLFDRVVPARNVIPYGFWSRFDQGRGVSPITSALNSFRDLYDGVEYALLKAKMHALMGAALYSSELELGNEFGGLPTADLTDAGGTGGAADAVATDENLAEQWKKFAPKGSALFQLAPGDKLELLQSSHPSSEFQAFTELVIHIALLAFDIPFTFWDSRAASFSARLGDNQQFRIALKSKQQDAIQWHDRWTLWRLNLAVNRDGELTLPRGMALEDVRWTWHSVAPYPWTNPSAEVKAGIDQINAGLLSPQRWCREHGYDFYELVDETAAAMAYAAERGVTLGQVLGTLRPGAAAAPQNQGATA